MTTAGERVPPTLFLSHSSKDRELTLELARHLEAGGACRVWTGEASIDVGQNFAQEIFAGIRQCDAFVVLLSRASLGSEHVRREVGLAVAGHRPVLPVMLEPGLIDAPELPGDWRYWLATVQAAEWTDGAAVASQLLRRVGTLSSVTPLQPPPILHYGSEDPRANWFRKGTNIAIGIVGFVVVALTLTMALTSRNGNAPTSETSGLSPSSTTPASATINASGTWMPGSPTPTGTHTYASVRLVTKRESFGFQVGDCQDVNVKQVECSEPHLQEMFAFADILNLEFPSQPAIDAAADAYCRSQYSIYIGNPSAQLPATLIVKPDKISWASGSRRIICSVWTNPPVRGSIKNR